MINIFKNKIEDVKSEKNFVLICALFVHAAKMDENYTDKEKSIILKALSEISDKNESELKIILEKAEKKENQSNHILEFTKEVKIATYFMLLVALTEESFIKRINIDPIRGRKVTADNIGKFI